MSRFGEYLLGRGALDETQLEETCLSQMVHGGRIGSNLVELGYMTLEDLAQHLSDYHGVPIPDEHWLESPDEHALKLIPSSLVRRYSVLPLRLESGRIHVAMLDPCDRHQLGLIRDMAKRPVTAYVVPEVRLAYWLETHCGIDPHPRYANLSARMRKTDEGEADAKSDFQPLGAGQELSTDASALEAHAVRPLTPLSESSPPPSAVPGGAAKPIDELLLEEVVLVGEITSKGEDRAIRAPAGPGEIAALEAELQGARDRDSVVDLGLRLASAFASSTALFFVRGDMVCGHCGLTGGVASRLEAILLPTDMPSLFTQPARSGQPFRGRPPHDGADGRVLRAIGRPEAHEVLIEPISIGGRVVNLLYADNGADALADTSVAALHALGITMAAAYERLIQETKASR